MFSYSSTSFILAVLSWLIFYKPNIQAQVEQRQQKKLTYMTESEFVLLGPPVVLARYIKVERILTIQHTAQQILLFLKLLTDACTCSTVSATSAIVILPFASD